MQRLFLLTGMLMLSANAIAQFSLSGFVRDAQNHESLPGATLQIESINRNVVTDEQGRYSFNNLPSGNYDIRVRFLGYTDRLQNVGIQENSTINFLLDASTVLTDEVVVLSTRANEKTPTTYSNLNKVAIQKQNFGQDLPMILNWSPSVVTTSDAGAGVGYTGIRIRGSDATRINVTLNGIPYNDSESQGVYWVDVPDIATSTQSMQIQRGVGTSSNGAGAFGATINLQTNTRNDQSYADVINSFGSFGTHKHTIGLGSGLINGKFVFDGRMSKINSDGFIDRASSDLSSYYFSGGYYGKKTIIKAIAFGGKEITYQSWYGVPQSRLNNDVPAMMATAADEGWNNEQTQNLLNSNARTFNPYTYKDQVDNYGQYHYQVHVSQQFEPSFTGNVSLHTTLGKGYYEEFRYDDSFSKYGLPAAVIGSDTIKSSDLVRRRWLDNYFYGFTWSLNYEKNKLTSVLGGGWNTYSGDHFGEITWAAVAINASKDHRYYFNNGKKDDFNVYWKNSYDLNSRMNVFIDLQLRNVKYAASGTENELQPFNVNANYTFFNPKIGYTYSVSAQDQFYISYSVGNREPVRDDFVNTPQAQQPKNESLYDLELGLRKKGERGYINMNYYLMTYKNQLVLTGALNDVGAAIRTNVDDSYRMGLEIDGMLRVTDRLSWNANLTLSRNKIKEFTEVLYDYGVNYDEYTEQKKTYSNTDISFSPEIIAGSSLIYRLFRNFDMTLLSKYVGKQYLDNTSNEDRKIDAYITNDVRLNYSVKPSWMREISISFLLNNIFDVKYSSNGYTYGFYAGLSDPHRQNYYYPQAGRNFIAMVALRF
ncbi:MAG TPA: TonB-dependent receptor [Cyclobacteriaceae bacterium]|nr:TonB-dependent receptor [Cyclobacteriaceae bacterium]